MSKRKVQTVSYDDAVADILNWVENPDNDENFELETNRFSNDSDDSNEEREKIQSEQEEEIEEPHVSCHRKILTSSRLVHSTDSSLDPDDYDEITYLNKDRCWETFVGYLGPKSNKAAEKIFWSSDLPSCSGWQRQCDIIPGGKYSILLGRAKHIETIEDAFDLLFDEEMFSLIESKTNEKIRKRTETLTKHKEHLSESSKYPWIKTTNIFELRALIGLLYFRDLLE